MKSNPKMIFNCSIETLKLIFEEPSFARRLCEPKLQRMVSWKSDFDITQSNSEQLVVDYETKRNGDVFNVHFSKISDTVLKCQVQTNFGWVGQISAIVVCFLIGVIANSDTAYGFGILIFLILIPLALAHHKYINSLCAGIKKRYEDHEDFLKLHDHLSKKTPLPQINYS